MAASLVTSVLPASLAFAAAGEGSAGETALSSESTAQASAKSTGAPTEVTSLTTAESRTVANPNGSFTREIDFVPSRVQQSDGSWRPVDMNLTTDAGGDIKPSVSAMPMTFTGGGSGRLAVATTNGATIDLDWDRPLPAPELSGNTATYRAVRPGVDLVVLALASGFEVNYILHSRPTQPLSLPLSVTADGASITQTADGALSIRDEHGTELGRGGAPTMWGATKNTTTDLPTRQAAVSSSLVGHGAGHGTWTLTPDLSFLRDPATAYPVTVDPLYSFGVSSDTYVKSDLTASQYYNIHLYIGTPDSGVTKARTYLHFNSIPTTFAGDYIQSAYVQLYNSYSASCATAGNPVKLNALTPGQGWTINTVWSNKPTADTSTTWSAYFAHNANSGNCGGAAYDDIYFTSFAQGWADGTETRHDLQLSTNETDTVGWKEFVSTDANNQHPAAYVTYWPYPNSPTQATPTITPATGTGPSNFWVGSGAFSLSEAVSTTSGTPVQGQFKIYNGGTLVYTGYGSTVTGSGTSTLSNLVPAAIGLSPGVSYTVRVFAYTNGATSATWSPYIQFHVDSVPTAPTGVSLTCTDGRATADWTPGTSSDPGSTYSVSLFEDGGATAVQGPLTITPLTKSTATFDSLEGGHSFTMKISASNIAGATTSTTSNACTTPNPISDPINPTFAVQGTTGYLDWSPPSSDGGSAITSYTVSVTPSGGTTTTYSTTSTSFDIPNLSESGVYAVTVNAVNAYGAGPVATATPLSSVAPTAAQDVSASSDSGSDGVDVSWRAPASAVDDLPNSLTGYDIALTANGTTVQSTTAGPDDWEVSFSGLTLGTAYSAVVTPSNRFGAGSSASAAVTAGQPASLVNLDAAAGDGSLTVTWDAPTAAPDSIVLTATPDGGTPVSATVAGTDTSAVISGLTNETSYSISASAQNTYGQTVVTAEAPIAPISAADSAATDSVDAAFQSDDPDTTVDTPTPVAASAADTSGYTTNVADSNELNSPSAVTVYSGTSPTTSAVTGVVVDGTGAPMQGTTVNLTVPGSDTLATTMTDSEGAFSITAIPATSTGTAYNLEAVGDSTHGSYLLANESYVAGQAYQVNMALSDTDSGFNMSAVGSAQPQYTSLATAGAPNYPSTTHMPPTILVDMYDQPDSADCASTLNKHLGTQRYGWKFYVQHVASQEVAVLGGSQAAIQANMLWESNYAWYKYIHHKYSGASYILKNTTNDQCFYPKGHVPTSWNTWVNNVLPYRLSSSATPVSPTPYVSGTKTCGAYDWTYNGVTYHFKPGGSEGTQWGSYALATGTGTHCTTAITDWKAVAAYYYYRTSVVRNLAPPTPATSYSNVSGGVHLNFPSQISGVHVGWNYRVDALEPNVINDEPKGTVWRSIYASGPSSTGLGDIPTSRTYMTNGACYSYRAMSSSPAGASSWASFAGGSQIGPGC